MGRDQNIDELFRQGLKDAEHPVGDHVWKGIEKSLPSFDTPRSGIRQLISSKTAISVFTTAVIVSGIAIFNYQQNNKQQPQRRDAIVETERPATAGESELKANDEQPEPAISDNDNKNEMQAMQPGLSHRDLGSNSVLSDQNPSIPSTETINSNETESTSSQNNEVTISKLTHQKTVVQELIKNTAVEPSASIEASPTSGYAPLAISFSNFGYAKTIKWDFGDGSQSGELAPLHTYEKAGNYRVTL
ncbi:MAG: PKD domain-containing protein, partial [Flavobacteriales bacterium]